MSEIALFLFLIAFFFYMAPTVKHQLAVMQEGDYFYEKFISFMKTERKVELLWFMVGCIVMNLLIQQFMALWLFLLLHAVAMAVLTLLHLKKPKESAPVWDARIIRLGIVALVLMLAVVLLLAWGFKTAFLWEVPFVMAFLGFMTDTWILIANWIVTPFENKLAKKAAAAAEKACEKRNAERARQGKTPMVVMGVAGTYGKTGFIHVLQQVLQGTLELTISKEGKAGTILIGAKTLQTAAERGTDGALLEIMCRRKGDVKNYLETLPVNCGAATSGAERNMETFLSKETLSATLDELAFTESISRDVPLLTLNCDDDMLRKRTNLKNVLRYGIYKGQDIPQHLDIWVQDIVCDLTGTSFTMKDKEGMSLSAHIPLLGRFAALYAAAAVGIAMRLHVSSEEIVRRLSALTPMEGYPVCLPEGEWPARVKKALARPWEEEGEETKKKAPFTALDAPDETSIEGAKDTLNLIAGFKGFRILVTRGMRGQGEKEDETNRQLGRAAAKCTDAIIVIGKEKFPFIEDGAQRGGMSMSELHLVSDFKEAMQRATELAGSVEKKSAVLFLGRAGR